MSMSTTITSAGAGVLTVGSGCSVTVSAPCAGALKLARICTIRQRRSRPLVGRLTVAAAFVPVAFLLVWLVRGIGVLGVVVGAKLLADRQERPTELVEVCLD